MNLRLFRGQKIPPWLALLLLFAAGAFIFWPSLSTPFFLDDYLHSAMVQGRFPGHRGPFGLYDFVSDDNRAALLDLGFLPWWTDNHLTLRFLRPLASVLLFYEHRWFDAQPLVMHLHSFAWWMVAVVAARAFFLRVVSARAAAFATVIFALAPCHALPLGWLANREALLAISFGTFGLSRLLAYREDGRIATALVSFAAFTLALLAGEYALCFGGYVLAFAWMSPKGEARRWTIWPFLVPALGYLAARHALGYGSEASGFYQDPLRDTWLFLSHVPWRLTALIMMGWFTQDTTAWTIDDAKWPVVAAVVVMVASGRVALLHAARQLAPAARRTFWILFLGSSLSLIPVMAVLPSLRLLGVAMLGIAPVVGVLLDVAWFGRETEAQRGVEEWTAIAATLLGFAHLVHGPGRAWLNGRQFRAFGQEFARNTSDLAKRLEGREAPDVVVVRALDDVFFYPFALEALGVRGVHWTVLSHGGHVLTLRRDASSLEVVAAADAALYPDSPGNLYRSQAHPLFLGQTLAMGDAATGAGFDATVTDQSPIGPRRVLFRFRSDIDDPRWTWVNETRPKGFEDTTPPKVGFGAPLDP